MRKMSVVSIVALLLGLTAIGMISGYYIGLRNSNQKPQPQIENVSDNKDNQDDDKINVKATDDDFETGLIEEKIGPNTILEYRTFYEECGHEIIESAELLKHLINMSEEAFETYIKGSHPKWEVEHFSHEKVVVKIHKDHLCQNHYIIGEKNGKIAVFSVGKNGERQVEKIYSDSPISLLKEVDQDKIEKGIITNSKEELEEILENYIS